MIAQTNSEFVCRFDDDDISLPWRLTWCVEKMDELNLEAVMPGNFWATHDGNPRDKRTSYEGGAMAQLFFRRDAFLEIGGYAPKSFGEDTSLYWAFEKRGKMKRYRVPHHVAFYVYRWGTGSEHLSGYGANGRGWEAIGSRNVQEGTFELNPHWAEDYIRRMQQTMFRKGVCTRCGERYYDQFSTDFFCKCPAPGLWK